MHTKFANAKFQLINESTNVPFDGLLGHDFFINQKTQIDYKNSTISIKELPFPISLYHSTRSYQNSGISINPGTETVILIHLTNPTCLQEGIITSQKLKNDGNLPPLNAMLKISDKNQGLITVINASNERKKFPIPKLKIESIFFQNQNKKKNQLNKNSSRSKLIKENLRFKHLNQEEQKLIEKICEDYEDIFHLSGDTLTQTSAISCDIRTTDEHPINTKYHRYPEVQKDEVSRQIDKMLKHSIIKPSISPW